MHIRRRSERLRCRRGSRRCECRRRCRARRTACERARQNVQRHGSETTSATRTGLHGSVRIAHGEGGSAQRLERERTQRWMSLAAGRSLRLSRSLCFCRSVACRQIAAAQSIATPPTLNRHAQQPRCRRANGRDGRRARRGSNSIVSSIPVHGARSRRNESIVEGGAQEGGRRGRTASLHHGVGESRSSGRGEREQWGRLACERSKQEKQRQRAAPAAPRCAPCARSRRRTWPRAHAASLDASKSEERDCTVLSNVYVRRTNESCIRLRWSLRVLMISRRCDPVRDRRFSSFCSLLAAAVVERLKRPSSASARSLCPAHTDLSQPD